MYVTRHGRERAGERIGLNKKSVDRMVEIALTHGIPHGQTTGKLRKFLDALYLSHRKSNNIRIYGFHVYLFAEEALITVIQLPNEYKKIVTKIKDRMNEHNKTSPANS